MRKSIRRPQRSRRPRSGAAAIECAIILPVLVTIVFGCVDFGRFAHSYIAVTNAARAGAGFASFHPYTTTTKAAWEQKTREAIEEELSGVLDITKVTIPAPIVSTDANGLQRVRIEVTYAFETAVQWPLLPQSVPLGRAVEMRFIR